MFRKLSPDCAASDAIVRAMSKHTPNDENVPSAVAERPRYSVVVPAYNEAFYLGRCLESLRHQDFSGSYEIIVVDNNSTDNTAQIARHAGAEVVFEPTPGVCHARQRGAEHARGLIIISADADTIYGPGWLDTVDRWFQQHPKDVAVGGPCYFWDGPQWGRTVQKLLFGAVVLVHRRGGPVLYVTATNFAFRASAFSGYDTRLAQGGDELDLLRKLRKRGEVSFDPSNPVHTSARRIEQGPVHSFAVSFFYYYILGYALNRLFGRPVLGAAPAIRRAPVAHLAPATPGRRLRRVG